MRLRAFWPSKLHEDLNKTKDYPDYNFIRYRAYESFEKKARENSQLRDEISKNGFFEMVEKDEDYKKKELEIKELEEKIALIKLPEVIVRQQTQRRNKFTLQEERKMEEEAFSKGIVRLDIPHCVNWSEAK